MTLTLYFVLAIATVSMMLLGRNRATIVAMGTVFYLVQAAFGVSLLSGGIDSTELVFFTMDHLGVLCFSLLALVSPAVFYHSIRYLDSESLPQFRFYNQLLIMLCVTISATYFANNLAVTWIFIETTTLCTAGLIYHRRTARSLEATWKYIFVCSTGIAIAYLGVLLLSTIAEDGDLAYKTLTQMAATGNQLYLKIAFVFILVGYSCKMEIFPLYTIGVDANFSAPAPASALISTALVNAGFVALFRVFSIMRASEIAQWTSNVLVVAGVMSLLIGALYLRRTNNFKRMLSYSSVENMGIVAIGLGVGGVGIYAALLHIVAHTFIKSGMFLQLSQVGKSFGTYRINRIGGYMNVNRLAAAAILVGATLLIAFPPSPLFVSEYIILSRIVELERWWLLVVIILMVCVVMYGLLNQIIKLCYKPSERKLPKYRPDRVGLWWSMMMIIGVSVLGMWQPLWFVEFLNAVIGS